MMRVSIRHDFLILIISSTPISAVTIDLKLCEINHKDSSHLSYKSDSSIALSLEFSTIHHSPFTIHLLHSSKQRPRSLCYLFVFIISHDT